MTIIERWQHRSNNTIEMRLSESMRPREVYRLTLRYSIDIRRQYDTGWRAFRTIDTSSSTNQM